MTADQELTPAAIIEILGLTRHPEGGWYVQTFRDANGGPRGHSTAIYYLLERGERSHWHRVRDAAEVWHHYAGAPLELSIAADSEPATVSAPRPRHSRRRAPTGARAAQLVAIRRLARRLDACRLHGGAGLRFLSLRDGGPRLGAA